MQTLRSSRIAAYVLIAPLALGLVACANSANPAASDASTTASASSNGSTYYGSSTALAISPITQVVQVSGSIQFTATGGTSPYTFSVSSGGGSVNSSTGVYTASATAGYVVVQVSDSAGSTAQAAVTVVTQIQTSTIVITPGNTSIVAGTSMTFTASGGTAPYSFAVTQGGGSFAANSSTTTANYTAPSSAQTVQITVQDANGATASTSLTVTGSSSNLLIQPVYRAYKTSTGEHFYSLSQTEEINAGYTVAGIGFYVYKSQQTGSVALYRCVVTTSGFHFVTTSSTCENQKSEGIYGYVYKSAGAGLAPLYRFFGSNGDHFVTLNYLEGVGAGMTYEGIQAYVPTQ